MATKSGSRSGGASGASGASSGHHTRSTPEGGFAEPSRVSTTRLTPALAKEFGRTAVRDGEGLWGQTDAQGRKFTNDPNTVKAWQTYLQSKGLYSGPIDGVFGTGTKSGTQLLQSQLGAKVDGIVGPETRYAATKKADYGGASAAASAASAAPLRAPDATLTPEQQDEVAYNQRKAVLAAPQINDAADAIEGGDTTFGRKVPTSVVSSADVPPVEPGRPPDTQAKDVASWETGKTVVKDAPVTPDATDAKSLAAEMRAVRAALGMPDKATPAPYTPPTATPLPEPAPYTPPKTKADTSVNLPSFPFPSTAADIPASPGAALVKPISADAIVKSLVDVAPNVAPSATPAASGAAVPPTRVMPDVPDTGAPMTAYEKTRAFGGPIEMPAGLEMPALPSLGPPEKSNLGALLAAIPSATNATSAAAPPLSVMEGGPERAALTSGNAAAVAPNAQGLSVAPASGLGGGISGGEHSTSGFDVGNALTNGTYGHSLSTGFNDSGEMAYRSPVGSGMSGDPAAQQTMQQAAQQAALMQAISGIASTNQYGGDY